MIGVIIPSTVLVAFLIAMAQVVIADEDEKTAIRLICRQKTDPDNE